MKVPTIDLTQLNNNGNPWPLYDPATAKKDCNVVKSIEAVYLFNGHKLTVKQARAAGRTIQGPTGTGFTARLFRAEGLVKKIDFITAEKQPVVSLEQMLHDGWFVGAFVDDGVLNAGPTPSGDKLYTGTHAIGLWGWRRSHTPRGILTWDHDSLFDGRRPAIVYGRQHVSFGPIEDAMEAYAGVGLWSGWAVKIPL